MSHIFHYFKHLSKPSYLPTKICTPSNKCFPYIICLPSNSCSYHPPKAAKAPPPTELAATGPSENPSNPGVAAPTNGVLSC